MVEQTDVQRTLDTLIRMRGEDYASVSRLLGRNAAYIQQFIKRGSPRKLDETDRRTLARHFGVDETLLGGPAARDDEAPSAGTPADDGMPSAWVVVPELDRGTPVEPGAPSAAGPPPCAIAFPRATLLGMGVADPASASAIRVDGDSMRPTLTDGDTILIDRADAEDRLRDGIYALRIGGALVVKRLAVNPAGRRFTIRSDNPNYPDWVDCSPAHAEVIGRVIWAGRRM